MTSASCKNAPGGSRRGWKEIGVRVQVLAWPLNRSWRAETRRSLSWEQSTLPPPPVAPSKGPQGDDHFRLHLERCFPMLIPKDSGGACTRGGQQDAGSCGRRGGLL